MLEQRRSQYQRDDALGECAARTVRDGNDLSVFLNGNLPIIDDAYHYPYKTKVLWGIIAAELAGYFRRNMPEVDRLIPEIKASLGINIAYPEPAEQKIYWWLLSKCPDISEAEINKAMCA